MFLTQIVKNKDVKAPNPLNNLIFMSFPFQSHVLLYHSYVIRTSLVCTRMSSVCHSYVTRMPSVCYSYVRTSMASLCHSYVLVCHPYVTRMYSYVIRMSLVCTRMSSVCHSYVILPRTLLNIMNSKKDNIHNNEVTFTFYEY